MTTDARSISRKLNQRFTRSVTATTRIRGWHNTTDGFEVRQGRTGVFIEYRIDQSFLRNKEAAFTKRAEMLFEMGEYLRNLGFMVFDQTNVIFVIKEEVKA